MTITEQFSFIREYCPDIWEKLQEEFCPSEFGEKNPLELDGVCRDIDGDCSICWDKVADKGCLKLTASQARDIIISQDTIKPYWKKLVKAMEEMSRLGYSFFSCGTEFTTESMLKTFAKKLKDLGYDAEYNKETKFLIVGW